jgi:ABC-type branched-subunit amino acid transport system substrate-binding protein
VEIGYSLNTDADALAAALGFSNGDKADGRVENKALADAINAAGGLLGHPNRLVPYDYNTTDDPGTSSAAACQAWTQDHHVFAVVDGSHSVTEPLMACLTKAGVPLVSNARYSQSAFRAYPLYVSPSIMTTERALPATVDRLVAMNFFSGWDTRRGGPGTAPVRIGVTYTDNAEGRTYVAVLKKALARHGLSIYAESGHADTIQANSSSTANAVLTFQAKGVTHVFQPNIFFLQGANRQGYHPRYGFDDSIGADSLSDFAPKGQLDGSMGSGYSPYMEVAELKPPTPAGAKCLELMRKAGEVAQAQSTRWGQTQICDVWQLLATAVRAGGELSAAGMMRGLDRLGGLFGSAMTYETWFGPGRRDGATAVRDYTYNTACTCFRLTSNRTYRVP